MKHVEKYSENLKAQKNYSSTKYKIDMKVEKNKTKPGPWLLSERV